jgi:autotransporter-associated beta strand protein
MPCLPAAPAGAIDLPCLQLLRFIRSIPFKLVMLMSALLPDAAPAAITNFVWDANAPAFSGGSGWNRAFNWSGDAAPGANSAAGLTNTDITFSGRRKLTPIMQNNYFIHALVFDETAGAFSLASQFSRILSIGAGGIVNRSTNMQTIATSLSLSNAQTWDAGVGGLAVRFAVNLGSNALTIDGAGRVGVSNVIRGGGALIKRGSGILTLSSGGQNTYSGGTRLNGGSITLAKANALGTGPLTVNSGTLNVGNFNQTVGAVTLAGGVISGNSGLLRGGSYQVQSGTVNAQLGGNGGLIKSGNGTVTLTAANSYTGGTTISGGKLVVNNSSGSGTGGGQVTVNTGGMLVGTGSIGGVVTNGAGGAISAGQGVGLLNTGPQVWSGGSTNVWEISDASSAAGTGWDLLNISGDLTINATTDNKVFIDVVSLTLAGLPGTASAFDSMQNYAWTLAKTSGGIVFAPGESELTVFELMLGGFGNPFSGGRFGLARANGGKDITVTYTAPMPIPEPEKWVFLVAGVCGYIYGRKSSR